MKKIGRLYSSPIIQRYPGNPILTAADVPYPSKLVYNAGVVKKDGQYFMVFRNDYGYDEKLKKSPHFQIGLATSLDGVKWQVYPKPLLERDASGEVMGSYDPHLHWFDGHFYITYAQYTRHGYRGTTVATDDFQHFVYLDRTVPDNRDIVLFPEKINDRYLRLERPFPYFSRNKKISFDIWISESPDLVYWGKSELLLCVEDVPFANDRIGAGAPPLRTSQGWLVLFHAVDIDQKRGKNGWEDKWISRYSVGAMLLDLENPRHIIGYSKSPLIAPEAPYEVQGGFRNNVLFPGGLVLEDSGEVEIYYGATDTVECLATAQSDDLIQHCLNGK